MPPRIAKRDPSPSAPNFAALVEAITQVHARMQGAAAKAINTALTCRNWLIGAYIHEYEMKGQDRAEYGERLMVRLAEELNRLAVPTTDRQRLYAYVAFYRTYPQLREALPEPWKLETPTNTAEEGPPMFRSVTGTSPRTGSHPDIVQSPTGRLPSTGQTLLNRLSYTHLELLTSMEDPFKRVFYEIECIRGNWSVRALKRQIATLYFERSGLSKDKDKLAQMAHATTEPSEPKLAIRDPYVFEFLGLKPKEAVSESDLEEALLDKLQDFLLELGHGFCFEARQKSILIGKTRGFVDLVFYHRILKCHVLIELKVDEFRHEHLGQLNTYVTWYRKHMMAEGDNPPVGLLLCTQKDHSLVEYALAGLDSRLFVSKYQLALPNKEEVQRFLEEKRREMNEHG